MRKIFLPIPSTLEYWRSTVVVGWAADNVMFNTCRTTGTNNRSRQFSVFIYPPVRCFENRTWPENVCNVLFTLFLCVWNTSSQVYFYNLYIYILLLFFVGERCEAGVSGGKQVGSMDEESTSQRFYNITFYLHTNQETVGSPLRWTHEHWPQQQTNNLLLQGHLGEKGRCRPNAQVLTP